MRRRRNDNLAVAYFDEHNARITAHSPQAVSRFDERTLVRSALRCGLASGNRRRVLSFEIRRCAALEKIMNRATRIRTCLDAGRDNRGVLASDIMISMNLALA